MNTTPQTLDRLCTFYEQLTLEDVARFDDYYAQNAYFKDPFHTVHQLSDIQSIFRHMFHVAPDAKFFMLQQFVNDNSAMVIWQMQLSVSKKHLTINGTTHFEFNDDGCVVLHRDYWDSGEELFAKLPMIGRPTRWLMKQFSALK